MGSNYQLLKVPSETPVQFRENLPEFCPVLLLRNPLSLILDPYF